MTNLDSILKSRDITLLTKVHLVKAIVFPVVMYGCESWTIKKAENWRIDTFELWCWRRLLRVLLTARRSYQSFLKIINPEYSLEALMLWPPGEKNWLNGKDPDTGERLKTGGEGNDRGWDGWVSSPTEWTWVRESSGVWCWAGKPCVLQSIRSLVVGHSCATELNWLLSPHHVERTTQCNIRFVVIVQSLSRVQLLITSWTAASQVFLSFIISESLLTLVSIECIQLSHPLPLSSPPALSLPQHWGLLPWISFSHQVAKVSGLHFQHQSFQWIFRVDFL